MNTKQPPYYEWDDLNNEVKLHNGTAWVVFDRSALVSAEQKLLAVRKLLEDPGIKKDQILLLLTSVENQ